MRQKLKVLISAYAYEPGKSSEPGVGWHMVRTIAKHHEVWTITRANNRSEDLGKRYIIHTMVFAAEFSRPSYRSFS